MVMIGMVGLYVGRISDEVKNRPGYVAAKKIAPKSETTAKKGAKLSKAG